MGKRSSINDTAILIWGFPLGKMERKENKKEKREGEKETEENRSK